MVETTPITDLPPLTGREYIVLVTLGGHAQTATKSRSEVEGILSALPVERQIEVRRALANGAIAELILAGITTLMRISKY